MHSAGTKSWRRRARGLVGGLAAGLGYELVRKTYYSPIPELTTLPVDIWTRRDPMAGVDFDPAAGLKYVQRELAEHLAGYRPAAQPGPDPRQFYLDNGLYESVDAETLYAMIRRWQPDRIVELGSGMSTLVIADARARNGQPPREGHDVFDPFPRADLGLDAVARVHPLSATDIPAGEFDRLRAGDVLFVDTTHTVKIGGDVNRIVLEVLPQLTSGVIVHIHDIYLPWDYPQEFLIQRRFFWAEQYLLQAFLAFNPEYEVLFGAHALSRLHAKELEGLIPGPWYGRASALWVRRR